jgi:hypothetical protein
LSKTTGAFGPMSIAIAPTPPVGLALPLGYTAMSEETTIAYLPSQAYDCTQLRELKSALVDP